MTYGAPDIRDALVILGGTALVIAVICGGFALVAYAAGRGSHDAPPCHYGTTETLVREQDGTARVVCACGRGRP